MVLLKVVALKLKQGYHLWIQLGGTHKTSLFMQLMHFSFFFWLT